MSNTPGVPPRPQTGRDVPHILLANHDQAALRALETELRASAWMPVVASGFEHACELLVSAAGPRLAIIGGGPDDTSGLELLRQIRMVATADQPYLIFVTHAADTDVAAAVEAGADDCLTTLKGSPFQMRVRLALRTVALSTELASCRLTLDTAHAQVKQLQSLLPICSYCRRIRDEEHHWQHLDEYLSYHTHVRFTHGFCPECYQVHVQPSLAAS
jgi:PleD family two-component response regulator